MDLKKNTKGGDTAHALSAPIYKGHVYTNENILKHNDIYKRTLRKELERLEKLEKTQKSQKTQKSKSKVKSKKK